MQIFGDPKFSPTLYQVNIVFISEKLIPMLKSTALKISVFNGMQN